MAWFSSLVTRHPSLICQRSTALNPAIARVILVGLALASAPASAQGWKPEKNVEIVVGLTAGSSQDRVGRALIQPYQRLALAKPARQTIPMV